MNLRFFRDLTLSAIAVGFMSSTAVQAQILYVSNLQEASTNGIAVGVERMVAQAFQTGDSSQYSLDTITISISKTGAPTNLTAYIYSDNAGVPGASLGILSGTPAVGDIPFDASGMILHGSTQYWIVLASTNSFSGGSFYTWDFTNSNAYTSQDNWGIIAGRGFNSLDGGNVWTNINSVAGAFQFSIDAVAIPEPAPLALGGVAAAAFAVLRRRRK